MILLRKRHAAAPRNQFEVAEKKMQALLKACVSNGTLAPFGSRCHALPSVAIAHTKNCPGYSPIELDLAFNGHLVYDVYETMMFSLHQKNSADFWPHPTSSNHWWPPSMLFSSVFCSEDYNGNGLVSLAEMDGCVTVAGQRWADNWSATFPAIKWPRFWWDFRFKTG